MADIEILEVTPDSIDSISLCGYKNAKRPGYMEKKQWLLARMADGLRMHVVQSCQDGTQGMIEYIPGQFCWRSIAADHLMVIHCLFVGLKSAYKYKGFAGQLLGQCEADAKKEELEGVAVVVRKGAFMAGPEIFLKHGYQVADQAKPDFALLYKPFRAGTGKPAFRPGVSQVCRAYQKGLFVLRADQCPYTVTNVREIAAAAQREFGLQARIVDLKTCREAQESPCPFGTFGILHEGEVIAHHPISATRFGNIMRQRT